MPDQWKHRSSGMKCGTCMWHVTKVTIAPDSKKKDPDPIADVNRSLGRCRRHAPTMNGFPAVFDADWCGDHKLDENKI